MERQLICLRWVGENHIADEMLNKAEVCKVLEHIRDEPGLVALSVTKVLNVSYHEITLYDKGEAVWSLDLNTGSTRAKLLDYLDSWIQYEGQLTLVGEKNARLD